MQASCHRQHLKIGLYDAHLRGPPCHQTVSSVLELAGEQFTNLGGAMARPYEMHPAAYIEFSSYEQQKFVDSMSHELRTCICQTHGGFASTNRDGYLESGPISKHVLGFCMLKGKSNA